MKRISPRIPLRLIESDCGIFAGRFDPMSSRSGCWVSSGLHARQTSLPPTVIWAVRRCGWPTLTGHNLAVLVEGGYGIVSVTPVDQFLWSPHVEVVALLERGRKRD